MGSARPPDELLMRFTVRTEVQTTHADPNMQTLKDSGVSKKIKSAVMNSMSIDVLRDAVQWLYVAAALGKNPLALLQAHQASSALLRKFLRRKGTRKDLIEEFAKEFDAEIALFRRGIVQRMKIARRK